MIILKVIYYHFSNFLRKFYWLYRLAKASIGRNTKLSFPIIAEGKGEIVLGNNCIISKGVKLRVGEGGKLWVGNNCRIDEDVELVVGKNAKIMIGNNCWIMKNSIIRTKNKFQFANNINIATNCSIFSREGGYEGVLKIESGTNIGDYAIIDVASNVYIGAEVAIGPNCVIYTHDHNYSDKEKAAWKGGVIAKPVLIDDGAWIASTVTVLPGIEIAKRTVVAAGAVLTKNTETNSVYAGVPATKIK